MNGGTRSTFAALALVLGLALTVVGGLLYMSNAPISEKEAIQKAARRTVDSKGRQMYEITDGEIHQAVRQRQATNTAREGRRQIGEAMAVAGFTLLVAGGLAVFAAPARTPPEPNSPKQLENRGAGKSDV